MSVAIVTYNSGRYIRRCLEALLRQKGVALEIVVVDNASTDDTCAILEEFAGSIRVIANSRNTGFAEAQNLAIGQTSADWVLTLNPDVLMRQGFVRALLDAGNSHPEVGTVCGKLLSIGPGFEPLPERRIDSTGIYFTPAMRHFDRGWHEADDCAFGRMEYVFGASAAAALYRRRMIEDVAIDGEFFDPDFFVYREDADVAWRAVLMGWRSLYTPAAVAYHVRSVTPTNRKAVAAALNMHSVKNRFLMRIKNATGDLYRRYWLPMTWRDLVVVCGSLLWEHMSIPAFWHVARCLPRALRRRRIIMSRRRASDETIAQWFSTEPASLPVAAEVAVEFPEAVPARPKRVASGMALFGGAG